MRILQIVFLLSFAFFVLVIPYLIFSFMQGENANQNLIIFVAAVFLINLIFIVRKLFGLKKKQ